MKLFWVLGDQLNFDSALWDDFCPEQDRVVMAEVVDESQKTLSSKARTLLFLSAMRHFAEAVNNKEWKIDYLDLSQQLSGFTEAIQLAIETHSATSITAVLPGDNRVRVEFETTCEALGVELNWLPDRHFIAEPGEFTTWLKKYKAPRMEYWYRHLRKLTGYLMKDGQPEGGKWNYDADNRKAFPKNGPDHSNVPQIIEDDITAQVRSDMASYLPNLPGRCEQNVWPLNRVQALEVLDEFIEYRLQRFGDYQDAMWTGEPWLYHSRLNTALNLKLLNPREVIEAAVHAYHHFDAPLNAVEGFVRQILGWREYVRGLYWTHAGQWSDMNALDAQQPLPDFYWTGDTDMTCLRESLSSVIEFGYGHHIQRLMVTGLFSLLLGVKPKEIDDWYLAMYVDAIDWVEVPNTIGMSQYADGGIVGSKPYIASGAYINKMSNYCKSCPFNPKKASGDDACPFTTLYWSFVERHQELLRKNPRLGMQVKNWERKSPAEQQAIRQQAKQFMARLE